MLLRRTSVALLLVGVVLALWPVKADATRWVLEGRSGAQPAAQLEQRWADPVQRPFLEARPRCGLPVLAPFTYMQDTALRSGCAGPHARSLSLAVVALLGGAVLALTLARQPARSAPQPTRQQAP